MPDEHALIYALGFDGVSADARLGDHEALFLRADGRSTVAAVPLPPAALAGIPCLVAVLIGIRRSQASARDTGTVG